MLLVVLFLLCAVILTLLVLIQRGRGGGLAGAFGGPGGHSAFGTKTADVFIKATAILGAVFFVLALLAAWLMKQDQLGGPAPEAPPPAEAPAEPGAAAPTGGEETAPTESDTETDAAETRGDTNAEPE
ncbi:MAG TPA: preprotein translocase subunit SecG [Phycisphaerae bacterium]|nr:preprotein translocase subunit SecG [Phycisphaerae bacterium]